jgi:hypothetical protein
MLLLHHGDAGRYEENLTLMNGTVVEMQFLNPHSIIVLDVADTAGKTVRWRAEMGAANNLVRQFGWKKDTLKAGDRITIIGRRVKGGSPYFNLTEMAKVIMTDSGKEIFRTPNALPGLTLR